MFWRLVTYVTVRQNRPSQLTFGLEVTAMKVKAFSWSDYWLQLGANGHFLSLNLMALLFVIMAWSGVSASLDATQNFLLTLSVVVFVLFQIASGALVSWVFAGSLVLFGLGFLSVHLGGPVLTGSTLAMAMVALILALTLITWVIHSITSRQPLSRPFLTVAWVGLVLTIYYSIYIPDSHELWYRKDTGKLASYTISFSGRETVLRQFEVRPVIENTIPVTMEAVPKTDLIGWVFPKDAKLTAHGQAIFTVWPPTLSDYNRVKKVRVESVAAGLARSDGLEIALARTYAAQLGLTLSCMMVVMDVSFNQKDLETAQTK